MFYRLKQAAVIGWHSAHNKTFLWFKAAVFHFFFPTSDQFSFPVCSEDSSCYGRPTVVLLSSNWSAPKCCRGIEPQAANLLPPWMLVQVLANWTSSTLGFMFFPSRTRGRFCVQNAETPFHSQREQTGCSAHCRKLCIWSHVSVD